MGGLGLQSIFKYGTDESGNFGHAGRPGEVGGSAPEGGGGGASINSGIGENSSTTAYSNSDTVETGLSKVESSWKERKTVDDCTKSIQKEFNVSKVIISDILVNKDAVAGILNSIGSRYAFIKDNISDAFKKPIKELHIVDDVATVVGRSDLKGGIDGAYNVTTGRLMIGVFNFQGERNSSAIADTAVHELGHHYSKSIFEITVDNKIDITSGNGKLFNGATKKISPKIIRDQISNYATTNLDELFVESFVKYNVPKSDYAKAPLPKKIDTFFRSIFPASKKSVDLYMETKINTTKLLGIEFSFNLENPWVDEFIDDYSYEFAGVVDAYTEESLKTVLQMGMEEGLAMNGIAKLVQDVFTMASDYRAEMIARTEVIRASNGATEMAYMQSGVVKGKQWLVTDDERTCPECIEMNGIIVDLGENFTEGDYPEDPYNDTPFPPLHPNCRCTTLSVLNDEFENEYANLLAEEEVNTETASVNEGSVLRKIGTDSSGNYGHAGRPNEVGGSAPGDGGGEAIGRTFQDVKSTAEISRLSDCNFALNEYVGNRADQGVINKKEVQEVLTGRLKDNVAFNKIVDNYSHFTDLDRGNSTHYMDEPNSGDVVRDLISVWAVTSGDNKPMSIALQKAANEEFNLKSTIEHFGPQEAFADNILQEFGDGLKAFLRAQYDATQEYFKEKGIEYIALARGMGASSLAPDIANGFYSEINAKLQPLSSFSMDLNQVYDFALGVTGDDTPHKPVVMVSIVPVNKIFSFPKTGFGCSLEKEVVVFGGTYKCSAWVGRDSFYIQDAEGGVKRTIFDFEDVMNLLSAMYSRQRKSIIKIGTESSGNYGHVGNSPHVGGSGQGGSADEKVQRGLRYHVPCTRGVQRQADDNEAKLAVLIGGKRTADNEPFDILFGKNMIEVKTIVRGKNDKITVHPESLRRKMEEIKAKKGIAHTVVFDERNNKVYYNEGVGSFRLGAMEYMGTKNTYRHSLLPRFKSFNAGVINGQDYFISR